MDKLSIATANGRYPEFYDVSSDKSIIRAIVSAIIAELDKTQLDINECNDMIGIDTTHGDDLYYRWGSFLMIPRLDGESDESYRSRLKLSISMLTGGTKFSVEYSIAVGMGINQDPIAMSNMIHVYDAWEYTGTVTHKDNGYIVCLIDLGNKIYSSDMETIVRNSVNMVKASGVSAQIIFTNYRVMYYSQLSNITYSSLSNITYNDIGVDQ